MLEIHFQQTLKKIDELLKDFQVLSFKSYQIPSVSSSEMICVVILNGYKLTFQSNFVVHNPTKEYSLSIADKKKNFIEIYAEDEILLQFDVSVDEFIKEFNLTKFQILDLFNEMAELLVDWNYFSHSNLSSNYKKFDQ